MSAKRPKVVHVFARQDDGCLHIQPDATPLVFSDYLGEYAPRGPVVAERWEVRYLADSGKWRLDSSHDSDRTGAHESREYQQVMNPHIPFKVFHITTRRVCR